MSNKSSENYLDNLLESISDIDKSKKTELDFVPENIFGDDPFGKKEEPEALFGDNPFEEPDNILEQGNKGTLSADDEFLREFEKELESDAYKDYFTDFEAELEEEQSQELELLTEHKEISENIDSILQGIEENSKEVEPVPAMPDPRTESAEEIISSIEKNDAARSELGSLDSLDDLGDLSELGDIQVIGEENAGGEPLILTESGEPDLAGVKDEDLIDLLAKTDGLSDLGDILQSDEADIPLDEEDTIGKFAEGEMSREEKEEEAEEGKTKGKKKEKKKSPKEKSKGGFLEKFKLLIFGEDEEEEEESKAKEEEASPQKNSAAELSDENAQILAELEGEEDSVPEKGNKKKEKAKKEKKAKAKKPAKEKKPKQKKEPKPKKEKKPKEKDNTPPLPKKPVIMILLMAASFVMLVMLGTSLLNYGSDLAIAEELYQKGSYYEGYEQLQGQKIKEKDEIFYAQLKILATVDSQYQAYLVFLKNGQEARAVDSLVCAAGRYDLNREKAVEAECQQEYDALGEKIANALAGYDMTLEEAVMLYSKPNRIEYTRALEDKLESLGLK